VFDEVASKLCSQSSTRTSFSMGGRDLPFVEVPCDCVLSSVGVEESVVAVSEVF
jgi:hypothetical protein